jgi:hypothetical protein
MSVSRWLRATSEHHLMVAAQEKIAAKYHVTPPRRPQGMEMFWRRVFVPVVRALPWPVRSGVLRRLPGSHRQTWTKGEKPRGPAV